jgi:hypothetical protein
MKAALTFFFRKGKNHSKHQKNNINKIEFINIFLISSLKYSKE